MYVGSIMFQSLAAVVVLLTGVAQNVEMYKNPKPNWHLYNLKSEKVLQKCLPTPKRPFFQHMSRNGREL